MSFFDRSLFGLNRFVLHKLSRGGSSGRAMGAKNRGRSLRLEPLEDRSLLSVGVSGVVWNDGDLNGLRSLINTEEVGVAGVVAEVFSSTDEVIGNEDDVSLGVAITDDDGLYSFADLPEAEHYYVEFRTPAGYEFTEKKAGEIWYGSRVSLIYSHLDSEANAEGVTELFTIAAETTAANINAGLIGDASASDWSFSIGDGLDGEYTGGNAVAVDPDGNVYVTGYAQFSASESEPTEIDFDPGPGTVTVLSGQAFVAKYTSAGALVWAAEVAPGTSSKGIDLALSSDGNVFATGTYYDSDSGDQGIFITQLDADGDASWTQTITLTGAQTDESNVATSIALGDDGSVCVVGSYRDTADFDPGEGVYELTSAGYTDAFILKLDADGNFVSAASIGGESTDIANDIAIAADGSVFVTGYFNSTVDFDPGEGEYTLTANESGSGSAAFVMKLDSTGALAWAKSTDGTGDAVGHAVVLADDGSVYVAGSFEDSTDFGLGGDSNILEAVDADPTIFALKLDSDGNFAWADTMTVSYDGKSIDATLGTDGYFYVSAFRYWSEQIQWNDFPGYISGPITSMREYHFINILAGWDESGDSSWICELDRIDANLIPGFGDIFSRAYYCGGIAFTEDGSLYTTFTSGLGGASINVQKFAGVSTPSSVLLSSGTVDDGLGVGSLVGELAVDASPMSEYTYSLVSGDGDDDNDSFTIDDGRLLTAEVFDAAVKDSYSIRVRATDDYGQYVEEIFTITVTDMTYGLTLTSHEYFNTATPAVIVGTAGGAEEVLDDTTVYLDVDLNYDGDFDDEGELGYATATFYNGSAVIQVTTELEDGEYQFRARSTDQNEEGTYSPVVATTIDTTPPKVCVYASESTNDQQQSIMVNAQEGMTLIFTPAGSGLADYATVYLDVDLNNDGDFDDEGETNYATATAGVYQSIWGSSCEFTLELPEGTYNLQARVSDLAGNEGTSDTETMTVDLTAPTVQIGYMSSTNDTTPSVTVTATEGETVYLDVDLNLDGDYDDDGETSYVTATLVDGSATFDITPELAEGIYRIQARVSDAAGNEGSDTEFFSIDTTAPVAELTAPEYTNSTTQTLTVVLDEIPLITMSGFYIVLDVDLNNDGDFDDDSEMTYDTYQFNVINDNIYEDRTAYLTTELPEGTYNLRVRVPDAAGNEGVSDVVTMTVDLSAPEVEIYVQEYVNTAYQHIGIFLPEYSSSPINPFPVFLGSETSSSTSLSNSNNIVSPIEYGCVLLDVDLNNDGDFDDAGELGYAVADPILAQGAYEALLELPEGTYNLRARAIDAAGNEGVSDVATMTVDFTPPEVFVVPLVGVGADSDFMEYMVYYGDENFDTCTLTASDITLTATGTATGTIYVGEISSTSTMVNGIPAYGIHVGISNITGEGTLSISIAAGTAVDLAGNLAPAFGPIDPHRVKQLIDKVVVAEAFAGSDLDGIMETTDKLLMTWAVDTYRVTMQSLTIDGESYASVGGPSAEGYCYCVLGQMPAGEHAYSIAVTYDNRLTRTYTGTFTVTEPPAPVGPEISRVVVAEALSGSDRDGVKEDSDKLVVTFKAASNTGITAKSLTIDGTAYAVYRAGASDNYYCVIGKQTAGTHAYEISMTDGNGTVTSSGSFDVAADVDSTGPEISLVTVAEAAGGSDRDGVKEDTDKLVITMKATSDAGITAKSLTVDGTAYTVFRSGTSDYYYCPIGKQTAGTHNYEISMTDADGTTTAGATFTVASDAVAPEISRVVVAEALAGSDLDGTMEVTDKLLVTWAVAADSRIVAKSLTIDGTAYNVHRSGTSDYYYCVLGQLSAGEYSFTISVTDAAGLTGTHDGTFEVASSAAAASLSLADDDLIDDLLSQDSLSSDLTDEVFAEYGVA